MVYAELVRPLLFSLEPEQAHELALRMAAWLSRSPLLARAVREIAARPREEPVELLGLRFPNRVGLAGGMDKNGMAPLAWWAFGFGFAELGTVTPKPQSGNDRPRMFRFPEKRAIVNRMGFNNEGAPALAQRLLATRASGKLPRMPLGISVGKNKTTVPERTRDDYAEAAAAVADVADFLTINVSSPNTPGLRSLQNASDLARLTSATRAAAKGKPVLVKIAPELGGEELAAVLDAVLAAGANGIVATNTLATAPFPELPQGGLSGRPLKEISVHKVEEVRRRIGDSAVVIGVGGVDDVASYQAMRDAGADLVQLYTALVYEGPFLPARITRKR